MNKLLQMLRDIGSDANTHQQFEADQEALMNRYGLDEQEKNAVRACDIDAIKKLTGASDVRLTKTSIDLYE